MSHNSTNLTDKQWQVTKKNRIRNSAKEKPAQVDYESYHVPLLSGEKNIDRFLTV